MITKVSDVKEIVNRGIRDPALVFAEVRALAMSEDWVKREVSATALVEISKKQPDRVIAEMIVWSEDKDPNVRTNSQRGLAPCCTKDSRGSASGSGNP